MPSVRRPNRRATVPWPVARKAIPPVRPRRPRPPPGLSGARAGDLPRGRRAHVADLGGGGPAVAGRGVLAPSLPADLPPSALPVLHRCHVRPVRLTDGGQVCQAVVGAALVPAVGLLGLRVFGPAAGICGRRLRRLLSRARLVLPATSGRRRCSWCSCGGRSSGSSRPTRQVEGAALAAGLLWGLSILTRETAPLLHSPRRPLARLAAPAARGRFARRCSSRRRSSWSSPGPARNWTGLRRVRARLDRRRAQPVAGEHPPLAPGGVRPVRGRPRPDREVRVRAPEGDRGDPRAPAALDLREARGEMPLFWEADSLPLVHIKRGAYGDVSATAGTLAAVVVLAPYLIVLASLRVGRRVVALSGDPSSSCCSSSRTTTRSTWRPTASRGTGFP